MYKLSPSKAHRFLQCTASLKYDTEFVETAASKCGTLLHTLAEYYLKSKSKQEISNLISENKISDYEFNLIDAYTSFVLYQIDKIKGKELLIEFKTPFSIFGFTMNAIIDAVIIADTVATLIDLKTGSVYVDADDNEQLMYYAYIIFNVYPKIKTVYSYIYQNFQAKEFVITRSECFDFFIEKEPIYDAISRDELTYNPSDKACKYCGNKDSCLAWAYWVIGGKK